MAPTIQRAARSSTGRVSLRSRRSIIGRRFMTALARAKRRRCSGIFSRRGVSGSRTIAIFGSHKATKSQKLRSEEHTSELQSLMRISYAVFCLKKKKEITQKKHNN